MCPGSSLQRPRRAEAAILNPCVLSESSTWLGGAVWKPGPPVSPWGHCTWGSCLSWNPSHATEGRSTAP
jgi:hypothetical protein